MYRDVIIWIKYGRMQRRRKRIEKGGINENVDSVEGNIEKWGMNELRTTLEKKNNESEWINKGNICEEKYKDGRKARKKTA